MSIFLSNYIENNFSNTLLKYNTDISKTDIQNYGIVYTI